MSGQNRKMVIAYKQFLSPWCHTNERKVLGNVLLLYTGCLQHITNKVIYSVCGRGGHNPHRIIGQTSNCFSNMPLVQVDLFKEPYLYFKIEKTF